MKKKKIKTFFITKIKKLFFLIVLAGLFVGFPLYIQDQPGQTWYWSLNNNRTPILTWSDYNTSSTITISWETEIERDSIVEYGKTSQLELSAITDSAPKRFHTISLSDLNPNTRYYYRVSSSQGKISKVSEIYSFVTAPKFNDSVHFAIYGDTRDSINGLQAVANGIMSMQEPVHFTIHVGDFVDKGGNRGHWNQYFERVSDIYANIPHIPVIGNHEFYGENTEELSDPDFPSLNKTLPEHFLKYFALPGNELYYSLNISNVHIAVMDSNVPGTVFYTSDETNRNTQAQWVYNDLLSINETYDWIFATYHHPEKRSHKYLIDTVNGARNMTINEIFHEGGVDAVFVGHVHSYERQEYEASGKKIPYIITGGGGAVLNSKYHWPDNQRIAGALTFQYLDIKINQKSFKMDCVDYNGFVLDTLTLEAN
jgi:Calcineurin-like phosphoesterase/Purple acid Phosphatase, N-terminal domain